MTVSVTTTPAADAACQNFAFAQKAYVWDVTNTTTTNSIVNATGVAVSDWASNMPSVTSLRNADIEESPEAGIRAVTEPTSGDYSGKPVMVGFNSAYDSDDENVMMQAAVFYPNDTFDSDGVTAEAWTSTFIANATLQSSDDYIYSNSIAKDINENLLVIGEAKRESAQNGAYNNRLFIADASEVVHLQ